jgi:hypothetical protein
MLDLKITQNERKRNKCYVEFTQNEYYKSQHTHKHKHTLKHTSQASIFFLPHNLNPSTTQHKTTLLHQSTTVDKHSTRYENERRYYTNKIKTNHISTHLLQKISPSFIYILV